MLKRRRRELFSRHNGSFRCFVVIALIVLLFGGLLHAGGLPAILTGIFVFLFLLTINNCPFGQSGTVLVTEHIAEQAPARAPPTSSL